jgi:hypothetical protein
MDLNQAVRSLSDLVNLGEPKKNLVVKVKTGETVLMLSGLIEINLEIASGSAVLRFRAPSFVDIVRKKLTENV